MKTKHNLKNPASKTSPKTSTPDRSAWLKGGDVPCQNSSCQASGPVRRIVLLGAPGVGKGTQAALLSQRLGACHLSTGDIFRAAKNLAPNELSPAMQEALNYMKRGALVPDETVLGLIRERVNCLKCPGGFLLDGFPRTVAQAEALELLLKQVEVQLTAVLNYDLPIEQIVARISGRRTCAGCKAVYHVTTMPSKVEGVCDKCGGKLFQREDDRPESVKVRMAAYEKSTRPLIEFYQKRGLLVTIAAEGSPEVIYQRTLASEKFC
jgi:adenylate kinase